MRRTFVLLLFVAATATAQPVITSVTPSTGKVTGGETVTIKGTGFQACLVCSPPTPPAVFFATLPAQSVQLVDSTTLLAVTPAMLPQTYDVTIQQFGPGEAILRQAYTVTGDPAEAFETILVPAYGPAVFGAYGGIFRSDVAAAAKTDQPVDVYGATDSRCKLLISPPPAPPDFLTVPGNGTYGFDPDCAPGPARLLYVRKDQAPYVTFNDRAADITRTASSLGTEIPIVRSNKMTSGRIVLANVPIDGRYRLMLRIYALRPTVAFVTTVGEPHTLQLQPGNSIFEPAYAQFTDFPVPVDPGSQSTIRVVIDQPQDIVAGPPMWAFITVTNNETQQITTITPD